ncbi:MAG: hypothetical protein K5921_05130 [Lachnospiraceae bacterium]|nr:hypothetical protein [Lachnospiraceae bacterium]
MLVGIIAVVYILSRPHYRSVKLDEYEGSVSLIRQEKPMEPYKGVMLIPGDLVETMQDSFAALFVDNDFETQKVYIKWLKAMGGFALYK